MVKLRGGSVQDNHQTQELLDAIHRVDKRVVTLETKIDDSINGRFKEHDRRLLNLEANQRWVALAVIASVLTAVMTLVLK